MEFTIHQAPPQLAGSVKAIWCARGTKQEFETPDPIVPDGCVEIVFNAGARFINTETGELQPRDLIAGQMTRPVIALPTGEVDLISVRFHTGRGAAALRVPMWELQDRLISGSDVVPGLGQLADDLRQAGQSTRLEYLARSLVRELGTVAPSTDAVDHALAIIEASNGCMPIETVARRVGVTRRHLERQFREHVGLSAKHLARIVRVHGVLDFLQRDSSMSGAEIAAACGYSDQAHMIRECQELAGRTPRGLRTTSRSLAGLMRAAA
jgi:AraC-like DNA-binding protein